MNTKIVLIGLGMLAVVGAGYYFFMRQPTTVTQGNVPGKGEDTSDQFWAKFGLTAAQTGADIFEQFFDMFDDDKATENEAEDSPLT